MPAPLLSASLFALWLAVARSASVGNVMLAFVVAFAIPPLTTRLRLTEGRVRRPLVVVRFIMRVGYDVLASNPEVAWGIVAWRWRRPRAAFVRIPLALRDPVALAALSMVTTVVPGTVWSELALDRSALLLHVWDVPDEQAFIARFKARYERPLQEIFE
jgi:multicomponent K+:H+ antiporter subunit E